MDEAKAPEAESVPSVVRPAVGNFDEVRQQGEAARAWWKEQLIAHPGQSMKVERVDKDGESTLFKTLTPSARGSHSWQLTSFLPSGAPQSHVDIIGKTPEDWKLDKVVGELPFSRGESHYRVVWQSSTEHSQGHSAKGKITSAMITKAKQVSILDIAAQNGVRLIRQDSQYYKWDQHDALVVDTKANMYTWNGHDRGGDAIMFAQKIAGLGDFKTVVRYLARGGLKHVEVQEKVREPFSYYLKDSKSFNKARNYLVNERKLSQKLIDSLHQVGLIRQDKYGRAIFVWRSGDKNVGATIQGTTTDKDKFGKHGAVKKIARNSEQHFGFNFNVGTPEKLVIFEAPIDALSFMTVNPRVTNTMVFAMDGVKQASAVNAIAYFYKQTGKLPEKIGIGVDNDVAGHHFYNEFVQYHESRAYSDKIPLVNLIANDRQIPKASFNAIQLAADKSGLEWPIVAAADKVLSNFTLDAGELENDHLKQVIGFLTKGEGSELQDKQIESYAKQYKRGNYKVVDRPAKDWNDIAKAVTVSKQPLGQTVRRAQTIAHKQPAHQREIAEQQLDK